MSVCPRARALSRVRFTVCLFLIARARILDNWSAPERKQTSEKVIEPAIEQQKVIYNEAHDTKKRF